jgi:menaquinone-dependent protoporphyrinogen oxidase
MSAKSISRRRFIKAAGITLGASCLTCSGLTYAATRTSQSQVPVVGTPQFTYGKESSMNQRVLVAYATRTGSTVDVAAAVGETLGARSFKVDVKPIKENPSPAGYQAVIVGSAVNGGQWLPEALEFVKQNRQALNQVPVALFCVHIMNLGSDEKSRQNRLAYLDAVRPLLRPVDEAFFAGLGMDPKDQSPLIRWAYRAFKVGPEGDCRDWNKIRTWAQTVFA